MSSYSVQLGAEQAERRLILRGIAEQVYALTRMRGQLGQFWAGLARQPRHLLELNGIMQSARIVSSHHAGVQQVRLACIVGSDGRAADFDRRFRPLFNHSQHRWLRVALAAAEGLTLAPVELIQIGEQYFVRDGHHRISVAAAYGQEEIAAVVTLWQLAQSSHTAMCRESRIALD